MKNWIWVVALLLLLGGCAGEAAQPADGGAASAQTEETPVPAEPDAPQAEAAPAYAGNETGNAELDEAVLQVLEEVCPAEGDAEACLAAAYHWVCDSITYRAGTVDTSGGFTEELTQQLALDGLNKRKGNCDTEAAVMAVLLERLGYDCEILQGQFLREDGQWVDHAWVLADIDGDLLHFDPLYGQHYAEDPMDYFMQPDAALASTHRWEGQPAAEQEG